MFSKWRLGLIVLSALCFGANVACAETWPSRPIRLVIGYPPGGVADLLTRLVKPELEKEFGVPIVVENRGGAQGTIGANVVAHADPDGYTFAVVADAYATSPGTTEDMPFDASKDLVAVGVLATSPTIITTAKKSDMKTFQDVLALGKKEPGALQYGSYGTGSLVHLAMLDLTRKAGIDATHIPYKGGGPLMIAAITNEVPLAVSSLALASPQLSEGQLRVLAVFGSKRSDRLPDVPSTGELGLSNAEVNAWYAVLAPSKVAPDVLDRMHDAINRALDAPSVKKVLEKQGLNDPKMSRDQFAVFLQSEINRWSQVARESDIKAGQ